MRPSESSPELARPRCAYTCCVPAGRHEDGAESGDTDEAVHGRLRADLVAQVPVRVRRRAIGAEGEVQRGQGD